MKSASKTTPIEIKTRVRATALTSIFQSRHQPEPIRTNAEIKFQLQYSNPLESKSATLKDD